MKYHAKYILMFILGLNLTGCVSIIKVNFASKVHSKQAMNDLGVGQDYEVDAEITDNKRK